MKNNTGLFLFVLLLSLASCSDVNRERLRAYVEDPKNGLSQKQDDSYASYHLMFRPNDLAYIYEQGSQKPDSRGLDRFNQEHENTSLFILDITLNEKAKSEIDDFTAIKEAYQNTLNAEHVHLKDGDENIPCIIYHCETIGKGSYRINLLFGKSLSQINNDWVVDFYDPVTGSQPQFTFKKEQLTHIPSLTI